MCLNESKEALMVALRLSSLILLVCLVSGGALSQPAPRPEGQAVPQSPPEQPQASPDTPDASPLEPSREVSPEARGDIFMARKMYREAADTYKDAIRDIAVVYNKVGIAYHQMMQFDAALDYYQRSLKINPDYPEAINNIGTVYYAKKNYGRAIDQYRRALKINPNSASIYSNLGTAEFARKRYKDAFEAYQKALSLDPEVFEHRSTHGVLLQERSVEERAMFHFYLAKTYAKAGVIDRALMYMRRALEEGFKDRHRFKEDPEFADLQDLPEFKELLALEPRVL